MIPPTIPQRDPFGWCVAIALGFLLLTWIGITIPSKQFFDEIHYVPAAQVLLSMQRPINAEHPMVGKEILAVALTLFGDNPFGWRAASWLFGSFGLFAFGRAVWWASQRRFATIAAMLLLATDFIWFVQSRIAMLDMFMAAFAMIAIWLLAAAVRKPAQARWRLALAGIVIALAIGSKWNALPLLALPWLTFLIMKLNDNGRRFVVARAGGPIPGISLLEAALWLGVVPIAVYWATFAPAFFYIHDAIDPYGPIAHHRFMLELQESVVKPHRYQSIWYEWVGNLRGVWYLYEPIDGAQRGVILLGNPFSMLAGLLVIIWSFWVGIMRQRRDVLAAVVLYAACLGMWVHSAKPVEFYYHYMLPSCFLMACLALALDDLWHRGKRLVPLAALAISITMFAWFYPILSASALHDGKPSFEKWMWLHSWR